MAKGGVIHIGVADHIYKITLFAAPAFHIGPGNGQKIMYHREFPFSLMKTV